MTLKIAPYEAIKVGQETYQLGMKVNHKQYTTEEVQKYGVVNSEDIYTFDHLNMSIPRKYVRDTCDSKASILSDWNSGRRCFERGLQEIETDTLELVIDLIGCNAVLNGNTVLEKVSTFLTHKKEYLSCPDQGAYTFKKLNKSIARFRNELIGTLCLEIQTNGVDAACLEYNKRVDPANYKRASAPITKRQIEDARNFVVTMGYEQSFRRRAATMDDISAHEILHINESTSGPAANVSIFDTLTPTKKKTTSPDFSKIPEVGISEFMSTILPKSKHLQVYVTNEMINNFVTLTTSEDKGSKKMFQWDNNFGWTYEGGLSGKSAIKKAVKAAGGFVDAPFRFSIMWNEDGRSIVDLDAHCMFGTSHVNYSNKKSRNVELDIDMIRPSKTGVENIFCRDLKTLSDNVYHFIINNYDGSNIYGTKAEIVVDSEVFTYDIPENFRNNVKIADVTMKGGKLVNIVHHANLTSSQSKEIYGVETNEFQPVELVCKSPNHWDDSSIGNLHYFFMLKGCKNPNTITTFHTDQLNSELTSHRKVIQLLATTTKVECPDNQLSGLGFNSTMSEEFVIKIDDSKLVKVKI